LLGAKTNLCKQQSGDIQQSHASGYDGTLAYVASKLKYRAKAQSGRSASLRSPGMMAGLTGRRAEAVDDDHSEPATR
jgi:hypothetical protein